MLSFFLLLFVTALFLPYAYTDEPSSSIIYVSVDGSDLHSDGTEKHPYKTIQKGINEAENGDTIIVRSGVYKGKDNRNINLKGKRITVKSENGPDTRIVDCEGCGYGFLFRNGEDSRTVIDGFTIKNGCFLYGGAIVCFNSSPRITHCIVKNNYAFYGGGIFLYNSSAEVFNCLVVRNFAFFGGGISAIKSTPTVTNCTISGNLAFVGGGVDVCWAVDITFNNNILWSNEAFYGRQLFVSRCSTATLNHCCYSNRCFDVIGKVETRNCINKNPLFVDSARGDYHLRKSSPCIDKGNDDYVIPCIGIGVREYTTDLDAKRRINDGDVDDKDVVDIGAFEFYDPTVGSGQFLGAIIDSDKWDEVRFTALLTPKPYKPRGPFDNRAAVGRFTDATLKLIYIDINCELVKVERKVRIDNITKEIFYHKSPVERLKEIFGPLPSTPLGGRVGLKLDFTYWLTVRLEPVVLFGN